MFIELKCQIYFLSHQIPDVSLAVFWCLLTSFLSELCEMCQSYSTMKGKQFNLARIYRTLSKKLPITTSKT